MIAGDECQGGGGDSKDRKTIQNDKCNKATIRNKNVNTPIILTYAQRLLTSEFSS